MYNKSPFKFLDAYKEEDYQFFFGRRTEERMLYEFVKKNRIVLVYGPLGSGKTSLVQCGLTNQFDHSDWKPLFIRRINNINDSLKEVIVNAIPLSEKLHHNESFDNVTIFAELKAINTYYLRPVFLIFDQFEELLIMGDEDEKREFKKTLKAIANPADSVACHVIFIMREEYFALLDDFEKEIPGISDRRIRVDPMRSREVEDVIKRSCAHFNIKLENEERNTGQIIKALSRKGDVPLPYLQVYLDQLWKTDYERTYPNGYTGKGFPPLDFTTEEIKEFGEITDVLQRFFQERKILIQKELAKKFPNIQEEFLGKVLDAFVTEQGTKLPIPFTNENGVYEFKKRGFKTLRELDPAMLRFTLDTLEENRILRKDGNTFELAHDALARLIDSQRDAKQRRLNGMRLMISTYKKLNEHIPYHQIKKWEEYVDSIDLKEDEKNFFTQSKDAGQKEEMKAQFEKIADEKKRQKMKSLLVYYPLIVIFLGFVIWYCFALANRYYALVYSAYRLDGIKNRTDAIHIAKNIYNFKYYDADTKNKLEDKMLEIVQDQAVQQKLAAFKFNLVSPKGLEQGDIDMSVNGRFIVVKKDSTEPYYFVLDTRDNKLVAAFTGVIYCYFSNKEEILLIAKNKPEVGADIDKTQPNLLLIYNCLNKNMDSCILKRGSLYPKAFVFRHGYPFGSGSYTARFTAAGNLLVPYFYKKPSDQYKFENRLLIRGLNGDWLHEIESQYSYSLSPDKKQILAAFTNSERNKVNIGVYDEYGNVVMPEIPACYYAEFTGNGKVVYIREGNLIFRKETGDSSRSIFVEPLLDNAFADKFPGYSVLQNSRFDSVYVLDARVPAGKEILNKFHDKLVGFNFDKNTIVTQPVGRSDSVLFFRHIADNKVDSFICRDGIESIKYNQPKNQVLVFAGKNAKTKYQYLYLLDQKNDSLKIKACFALTANDSYGFSDDGEKIYYVRDNHLNVFNNDDNLFRVTDFNETFNWINTNKEFQVSDDDLLELRKKYRLKFPSQFVVF